MRCFYLTRGQRSALRALVSGEIVTSQMLLNNWTQYLLHNLEADSLEQYCGFFANNVSSVYNNEHATFYH